MERIKLCEFHDLKVIVFCCENECKHRLLCTFCFKNHENHVKNFISYDDAFDSNGTLKPTVHENIVNLNRTNEDNFRNLLNDFMKNQQEEILSNIKSVENSMIDIIKKTTQTKFSTAIENLSEDIRNNPSKEMDSQLGNLQTLKSLEVALQRKRKRNVLFLDDMEGKIQKVLHSCKNFSKEFTDRINLQLNSLLTRYENPALNFKKSKEVEMINYKGVYSYILSDSKFFLSTINITTPSKSSTKSCSSTSSSLNDNAYEIYIYNNFDNFVKRTTTEKINITLNTRKDFQVYLSESLFLIDYTNFNHTISKYDLSSKQMVKTKNINEIINDLPSQNYYEIYLMSDQGNLYIIYPSSKNDNFFSICTIDQQSLSVIDTFHSDIEPYKGYPAFIINQVIYFLDSFNHSPAKVNYCFDLNNRDSFTVDMEFQNTGGRHMNYYYDYNEKVLYTVNNSKLYSYKQS